MYDNKLLEIDFYKNSRIHKLMLPYIGSEYEKYKVLIVAESHYLREDSDREKVKDFNKWLADKNEIKLMNEEYINTREVVKKHCSKNNKQPFFSNIKKEIINIEKFWDKVSFMNFFIVPSINGSRTIAVSKDIEKKSLENFENVLDVIKPNYILFLSKKSYYIFEKSNSKYLKNIFGFGHPSSPWWSRKRKDGKKYKEEFKEKIEEIFDKKI
ncbi:MAG: hypothetical protein ACFNJI_03985 [Leptotrichia hongkongensis]